MNYKQEYNKLFEYFSSKIQDKVTTSDQLIEKFENNYYIETYIPNDFENYRHMQLEKEIKVLEDLTSIIEELKIGLMELRKSNTKKARRKFDELIELANTRKSIYCSENDEPPERPEGFEFIRAKILEPKYPEVYSDEYVGPESEEIIQDNEIPDW